MPFRNITIAGLTGFDKPSAIMMVASPAGPARPGIGPLEPDGPGA